MQLPKELIESLQSVKNFDEQNFETAHHQLPNVSIRINPYKKNYNVKDLEKVGWSQYGYYLATRPEFVLDPLWHAGAYYVQEASSMFLEQVFTQHINLQSDIKILDLCAAPGGKSTHIASLISQNSLLISNEVIGSRANILTENIGKWGQVNTWVSHNDPKQFGELKHFFDVLIIDAPCSGSGLFRKDAEAINEWSENNVNLCAERQKRILHDAINCLKPNGVLVYMTCSYSVKENEDVCDYIIENFDCESLSLNANEEWKITETLSNKKQAYGYRFFPHLTKGEGFFLACFKQKDFDYKEEKNKITPNKINSSIEDWVNAKDLHFIENDKNIFAINPTHFSYLNYLLKHKIKIIKKGVHVGEMNFKNFVPAHELAMSNIINLETPTIKIEKKQALQYLAKQEIQITNQTKGWYILQNNDCNLGWIKHLGNRINNYYPTNWRIRKQID